MFEREKFNVTVTPEELPEKVDDCYECEPRYLQIWVKKEKCDLEDLKTVRRFFEEHKGEGPLNIIVEEIPHPPVMWRLPTTPPPPRGKLAKSNKSHILDKFEEFCIQEVKKDTNRFEKYARDIWGKISQECKDEESRMFVEFSRSIEDVDDENKPKLDGHILMNAKEAELGLNR
jgi:hypothetical protein